ncbi:MAG: hypothetical protein Q9163_002694, partial [Psora crenata]
GQCTKILKRVNPDPEGPGRTVFTALEQAFDKTNQYTDRYVVQTAESVFTTIPGTVTDRIERGYRQLFLYVMRYYREMIPGSTRMELKGKKKLIKGIHIPEAPDKAVWYRFVALADRLGFVSIEIASLKCWDAADIDVPSEYAPPPFVTVESGELDKRRSGRPFDLAYKQSRYALFLDDVHRVDMSRGRRITPFFVRRSIYLAFLGHLSFPGQDDRVQEDPAQRDASLGEAASVGTLPPQSSQERSIPEETREEARPIPDEEALPESWPPHWEAVLEQNIGRVEPQSGGDRWGSEALSLVRSSYYSTEDEELQEPTLAYADDEGHLPEVTDSSKVCVKFVLREGDNWVDQENLSIDPA